jgi:hypothetical protein
MSLRLGQTKTIELIFVASPLRHASLSNKSKDWLTQIQDNMSEWINMSFSELF